MGRKAGSVLSPIGVFRKMTGYGPWRILPDCPASWHNTLSAARGDGRRTGSFLKCYCPRAEQLLKEYNDRRAAVRAQDRRPGAEPRVKNPNLSRGGAARAGLMRRNPMLMFGGGPWRLDPECPGYIHNTLRAARGKVTVEGSYYPEKCICPQAQALMREYLDRQILRRRLIRSGEQLEDGRTMENRRAMTGNVVMPRGAGRTEALVQRSRVAASAVILADMPDLAGGRCTTGDPELQRVFANAIMSADDDGYAMRVAKQICAACPLAVRERCAKWVLEGEQSPGDWGGVYGGLSPLDRRNAQYGSRNRDFLATRGVQA